MQRKFLLSLTMVLAWLSLTISLIACSDAQSKEKAALTSLKKLQSQIELGINIKDYSESLQEARFAVQQITTETEESRFMKSSVEGHKLALNWWRCKLEGYDDDKDAKCRDGFLPDIFNKFASVKSKFEPILEKNKLTYKSRALDAEYVLQLMWIESHKDVLNAELVISKEKK